MNDIIFRKLFPRKNFERLSVQFSLTGSYPSLKEIEKELPEMEIDEYQKLINDLKFKYQTSSIRIFPMWKDFTYSTFDLGKKKNLLYFPDFDMFLEVEKRNLQTVTPNSVVIINKAQQLFIIPKIRSNLKNVIFTYIPERQEIEVTHIKVLSSWSGRVEKSIVQYIKVRDGR